MIVGLQGPPGGGIALFFTSLCITNTAAPAQAKNWLFPWGLTTYPATAASAVGLRIYPPNSGTIRALRASRQASAADLTFAIDVNGTQQLTLLLPSGSGAAQADLVSTYAFTQTGSDYLQVTLTAATPDTASVFPQLAFLID